MRCPRCDRETAKEDRFCGRCGLACSTDGKPVDPLIGITVAQRYRIIERIGVGGMGTVYRGEHIRCGQSVAIKVLHERYASDKKLIQRFEKEALSYGQVTHPNLVGLHDYGHTPDGTCFMVLDYCPGISLARLIREQGRLSSGLAADIVLQIAQALSAAHRKGIIHRDLKPENVILMETSPGRYHARLLDFGIAKRTDDDGPRLTQAGMVFGTPEYMAPEQARGKNVDGRSDLYALGTMLYELLVGDPPFSGPDKLQVMAQQANEAPEPPSKRAPNCEISSGLEAIVLQCLEKEPDHRFQDCVAFIKALDQVSTVGERSHEVGLESGIMASTPLTETVDVTGESLFLRPSEVTLSSRSASKGSGMNRRPPLFPWPSWPAWSVGIGGGLLILLILAKAQPGVEEPGPGIEVIGSNAFALSIQKLALETHDAIRAVKEAREIAEALKRAERLKMEHARQALARDKKLKKARLKKKALAQAKKALKEGRFKAVENATGKILSSAPSDREAKRLRAQASRVRKALLAAQKSFKKADCIKTLAQLKPVIRAAPRARSVTRMANACKQALPPKHL